MASRPSARLAVTLTASLVLAAVALLLGDHYRGLLGDRDKFRLSAIGRAIRAYNDDHHGKYPKSLASLPLDRHVLEADAGLPIFGRDSTFVYLGHDLASETVGDRTVIAYAPLSDNNRIGTDVLYGNDEVEWVSAADLPAVLARGGPTTATATRPATALAR